MKKNKIINWILAGMFFMFALLQLNDPDPVLWFSLYFLVTLLFVYANYKNVSRNLIRVLIIVYTIYSAWYFSYFMNWIQIEHKEELFGKMVYEKPYLEGTREFLGLLIAVAGMVYLYLKTPKVKA